MTLTKEDLAAISELLDVKFIQVDKRLSVVEERLNVVEERLDKMEERLDKMEERLDRMDGNIVALRTGQSEIRSDLNKLSKRVDDIYDHVLDNWGEIQESKKRLERLENMKAS